MSVPQTFHSIEKIFIPGSLPYVTRRRAKKLFDIALVKLGRLCYCADKHHLANYFFSRERCEQLSG